MVHNAGMTETVEGTASIVVERAPAEVWAAVAEVNRIGEWSPENTAARWIAGAEGPAVGARFEGDNEAKAGPVTLKRWTTTSEVTECEPGKVFEFVAEDFTRWRFEFDPVGDATKVTESFSHPQYGRLQRFVYNLAGSRQRAMVKGMETTLARLKAALESD